MKLWKQFASLWFFIVLSPVFFFISCTAGEDVPKDEEPSEEETVEGESDLSAEASFKMDTAADCITNFSSRPFLSLIASRRGWGSTEITAFCNRLNTVKTSYATGTTLTVATFIGLSQVNASNIENALYIGAVGYDLTALRTWLKASVGDGNVRKCMRRARTRKLIFGSVPKGFVLDCLKDETGVSYPGSMFKVRLSNVTLSSLGDVGVGAGISVAMLSVPGVGIVVGFLGGAAYMESNPVYAAFLGCGAMAGVVVVDGAAGASATSPICMAAAFADTTEP